MSKRNQRHLKPKTLCVIVDARASPTTGICVAPDTPEWETKSTCENWSPPNTIA